MIGALSNSPGGIVFNNRVLVYNSLRRKERVVFYNYVRGESGIDDVGIEIVGWWRFVCRVVCERPCSVWVHTSRRGRFFLYYPLLLVTSLLSSSRLKLVLHSGAASVDFLAGLPKTDVYLLDRNLYSRIREKAAVWSYAEIFVDELKAYLECEIRTSLSTMTPAERIIISKPYIVTTGYINETYNFNQLIRAYTREERTDIAFVIISYGQVKAGSYSEEFHALAKSPGIMHLRDISRNQYLDLLARSECLVRATRWDSFGIVMYEAHELGTPVLASKVPNYRPDFVNLFELESLERSGLLRLVEQEAGIEWCNAMAKSTVVGSDAAKRCC